MQSIQEYRNNIQAKHPNIKQESSNYSFKKIANAYEDVGA